MPYIFDAILSETIEEHALAYARGMVWADVEGQHTDWPKCRRHVDTIDSVGVYYDYAADYYFYTDETEREES